MKVKQVKFDALRNDEAFQFSTEVLNLADTLPDSIKSSPLVVKYRTIHSDFDEALKKIIKSPITAEISLVDQERDTIYRGMVESNKSMTKHFAKEKRDSATRIQVVVKTYGNVSLLPLNEKTSAIYNLTTELTTNHTADVATVGIGDWITELLAVNNNLSELMRKRYGEAAGKTQLNVREVRQQINTAYRDVVTIIEGLSLIDADPIFQSIISNLNAVVSKYNTVVSQRRGIKKPIADTPSTPGGV